MKSEPPSDSAQKRAPWKASTGALLVTLVSIITVLGSVLLSSLGQPPRSQPVVRLPESTVVELVPTAPIATPLPVTIIPTAARTNTVEPTDEASPTSPVEPQTGTSTLSPGIDATATLPIATVSEPSATPWPCAGGAPMHWRLYIVEQGDTLFSLARRHDTSMYWVGYYNCLTSYQVWTGQRLYLPALFTPVPNATATATYVPKAAPTSDLPSPASPTAPPSPTLAASPTTAPAPFPSATATIIVSPTLTQTVIPTLTPTISATLPALPTTTPTGTPTAIVTATATLDPLLSSTPTETPPASPTGQNGTAP